MIPNPEPASNQLQALPPSEPVHVGSAWQRTDDAKSNPNPLAFPGSPDTDNTQSPPRNDN